MHAYARELSLNLPREMKVLIPGTETIFDGWFCSFCCGDREKHFSLLSSFRGTAGIHSWYLLMSMSTYSMLYNIYIIFIIIYILSFNIPHFIPCFLVQLFNNPKTSRLHHYHCIAASPGLWHLWTGGGCACIHPLRNRQADENRGAGGSRGGQMQQPFGHIQTVKKRR